MISPLSHWTKRLTRLLQGDALKARAARSAIWTIGSMAGSQFLRLASNLILTRLLFPEAFGMMALVQIFITGLAMFSDIGIRASIIQNDRSDEPAFLNTAWTLQVFRGVMLWLFACAIALPVAALYDEPMLAQLLPVAGLTALIGGFTPTRVNTANRDLVMGRITLIDIGTQAVGIVVMVILAWLLQSVWALVFGAILSALIKQVLYMVLMPGHRNRLEIDRSAMGELVHFGKWIFLSTALGFMINHADRAILGKFITLEMLGIYSIGFFLASVPLLLAQPLASKIIFPLYKQRPPWESADNQRKIFHMRWWLTGALLAIAAVLVLTGDLLVRFLYDTRYTLAGPILVLMVISQLPLVILASYDQILLAAGDSKRFMTRIAITAFTRTALLILGVMQFGLTGAILAPGLAALLVYPVLISAVRRYDGWDPKHDMVYGAVALVIAVAGLWVNQGAISDLITQTAP
ncbi:oligosaccharide flippase family protein [Yoonia sp.]|uniref:oligosaccharide flippase family protein n=1 Tax=Yoonia sp. TaxID=2212373 RepID=UPI0019E6A352|nr:oligosaccharide flippase family protein [Yoonia sp.]MBE0414691.1 oligosaccharide flippase family protein [Yoonia sp.]